MCNNLQHKPFARLPLNQPNLRYSLYAKRSLSDIFQRFRHLGPLTQKDIGQKLLVSKSNVVTVIDKLEARRFVKRQRSLEDRRCVFIHLTEEGREEIEQIMPVHVSAIT